MNSAAIPENESRRLDALRRYQILDTLPEESFDEIARLAASICNKPIALIGLIDADRQWFKSCHGIDITEIQRDLSFCAHAILNPAQIYIVEDALADERFHGHPLVTGSHKIRFYAGCPLNTLTGETFGTLCVLDQVPGILTQEQKDALCILAHQVVMQMELRYALIQSEMQIDEMRQVENQRNHLEFIKRQFISNVSHELRTPLTSIRGSLGLMMSGAAGEVPQRITGLMDIAYNNSERLTLLVNDILDMDKFESGQMVMDMRRVALNTLLEDVIELHRPYAQKFSVTFNLDGALYQGELFLDRDRFIQVVSNLLSNAVKFSHEGGVVTISTQEAGGNIRISVADKGSGIPDAFHGRIFDKFAQVDGSNTKTSGAGLGLHISKRVVEAMNGTISFVSKPGDTVFSIEFPKLLD